jgi:hypothetical protein
MNCDVLSYYELAGCRSTLAGNVKALPKWGFIVARQLGLVLGIITAADWKVQKLLY